MANNRQAANRMLGIFTDDYLPFTGGMGRYVSDMSCRLPREDTVIFSPRDNCIVNHHKVNPPLHSWLGNISLSFWLHWNLDSIIRRWSLNRINIHCGPGGLFVLKKPKVPMIATCHHTWWQQSHYIREQFWKKVFIPLEIQTYRLADRIICVSEDSRNILVEKYGIPAQKSVVIHPGIDTEKFFPLEGTEKIPHSILYVGRVDKRKGIDFLIRSMNEVVTHLREATLYVGGTGKDLAAMKAYSKENGLEKNIRFLGFIPDEELNLWYNRVQCVVIPSVFEGFGLTAVEAMAAGTSVICTAVDSLRYLVEDGISGSVVTYGEECDLSTKIVSLLIDESARKRYSLNGRKRALAMFDWEVSIKRLGKELLE
jgi:glycosyltransferase involved in cell wall biosynthesis